MIALCLFCWMGAKGQHTIVMDSSICRIEITRGGQIEEMFLVDRIMYVDRGSVPEILIFDGISTWRGRADEIVNYVTIAALKTDIDTYIAACR